MLEHVLELETARMKSGLFGTSTLLIVYHASNDLFSPTCTAQAVNKLISELVISNHCLHYTPSLHRKSIRGATIFCYGQGYVYCSLWVLEA